MPNISPLYIVSVIFQVVDKDSQRHPQIRRYLWFIAIVAFE